MKTALTLYALPLLLLYGIHLDQEELSLIKCLCNSAFIQRYYRLHHIVYDISGSFDVLLASVCLIPLAKTHSPKIHDTMHKLNVSCHERMVNVP